MVVAVPAPASARARRTALAIGAWVALVGTAVVWGWSAADREVGLGAAPFVGAWEVRMGPATVLAVVLAAAVVRAGPRLATRLPWRALPPTTAAGAVAFAVTVAAIDGWDRVTAPLTNRHEYEPFAATVDSARSFIAHFVELVPQLPTHVKSHPPFATTVPWLLDQVGLGGAGWLAALVIAGWGVAVAATLVAARAVLGETRARGVAPALVLLPATLWAATSMDALFAGVGAVGVALAVCRRADRRFALVGGVVLGGAMLLSYGAVLLLAIPVAVAWHRRRAADVLAVAVGVVVVLLAAALAGFWWLDGLTAARVEYWDGFAGDRPLGYLASVGNPAALAVAAGPAVAAGLARRRIHDPLLLGALVAVVVADVSLLSAGEVERIWLPFVPWLALAVAGNDRRWLAAQAATALGLASVLRSPW
jgi:hypothetical protein